MSDEPAEHLTSRWRRRVGWGLGIIAAALAAVSLTLAISTLVFTLRAGEAAGEVVALETAKDADGGVRVPVEYQVVVEFPDHNGQFRRFTSSSTSETPPAVGSEVKVLYDRRRPSTARVENLSQMYRGAIIAGVWAMVIGLAAEELVRGARPRRKPPSGR